MISQISNKRLFSTNIGISHAPPPPLCSQKGAGSSLSDPVQPLSSPCSAVSTFWMANPNNNLINCAAAGSEVSRNKPGGADRGFPANVCVQSTRPHLRVSGEGESCDLVLNDSSVCHFVTPVTIANE